MNDITFDTTLDVSRFIHVLKNCLPKTDKTIALHEPSFEGQEWNYVKECLDTNWVSSGGKFVDRFELDLANYTGAKHCIVTANGTAALHVIFQLAGICPNDEVLVPTLTFVGTCNAIQYCGAIPHFFDSEENHLGVHLEKLEDYLSQVTQIRKNICFNQLTGRPIRALCVMHTFGHPVDLDPIIDLCKRYHLILLEDAAEALGSFYKGKHVGHHGLMGALSFNGNKIVTTGGGGAILTDDDKIAKRAKHLTTTAKVSHAWQYYHDQVGYNYRLPNINAALGCAQLENLPDFLKRKRLLAEKYFHAFQNFPGMTFCHEPNFAKSNYWLNAIVLDKDFVHQRDVILDSANQQQLLLRPLWVLMHKLPAFRDCPAMDLSVAEMLEKRIINLPSSAFLVGDWR